MSEQDQPQQEQVIERSPQPQPAQDQPATRAEQSILHDIETASETMAMYTAIIGKRPEIVEMPVDASLEDGPPPILTISPNWPHVNRQVISVWFRRMSLHARRRIDEALMRIAG